MSRSNTHVPCAVWDADFKARGEGSVLTLKVQGAKNIKYRVSCRISRNNGDKIHVIENGNEN